MSFQQGLSGLNTSSKNLDVIGNNIANANTYGAKSSRAEFADMYAASLNGNGVSSIGIGVRLATVAQQFSQGNITTTDNSLDLAINGGGFFQLTDGKSPITYSRNGQFKVNSDGYIVNNDGLNLLGYAADAAGAIVPGLAVPLQLPTGGIAPQATTSMELELNLNSGKETTDPGAAVVPRIDFTDVESFNDATSITAYDVKGEAVELSYYFQKTDTDQWNVYLTANGTTVGGTDGDPQPVGTVVFDEYGKNPSPSTMTLNIPSVNSADIELDISGMTQYSQTFGVTNASQDGFKAGSLTSIAIDSTGVVMARYSNGQTKSAGQLELATFRNNQGLQPVGGNGWQRTFASGDPVVGAPAQGNRGVIQAGALEESNVDLTGELVNMITAQRNYQANAQTIKTMDQVLQTLVNLR